MEKKESILVLCVDRDNDLGKKTGIPGPVIGKDACIKAAARLALADPTDSDSNSMFGAVRKYEEVKEYAAAEVAFLTGVGKTGFESDRKVSQQLDIVLEQFPATGIALVTDGAEDDEVIPILQGRAPIVSKETIIVSQASEVESTYYTIKHALQDPDFQRTFILVPGIVVLLWGILAFMNAQELFFRSFLVVVGAYLILKGTGIEERIAGAVSSVTSSISLQRVSFPFYLMTILFFMFGAYASFAEFSIRDSSIVSRISESVGQMLLFLALTAISFVAGKSVDAIQLKRAYNIRKYFLSGSAVLILWFILDSARQVMVGKPYADITWFATNAIASFMLGLAAYKLSQALDLSKKITKLLIGLPVYAKDGRWIGLVESINAKESIEYKNRQTNKTAKLESGDFVFSEGRILIV
ncbi:MAG: DUF373 family protein [Candidatus Diapherotrites archaeon]|uniref:DUF373 family protein n=1 Tax=Candidatus Iainarchaeum sp. TaxID=3101447 RepID=A0A8T3YLU2_9ARCH|nr:DUF373 family protein [Candidatus Diapherotrites archaeon]